MEETKAKTSIVEDSRKKDEEEKIRRIRREEWTRMSAGLAIQNDKEGRKGETMNLRGRVNYRDI